MKILIVEDETVAFENLSTILHEIDPSIEVIGNTESIKQTIHWMQNNTAPDLILMDIHLSDGSAFTIFESIELETPIIFTTAYDEHAIDAFKVNSIDYLLKPINPEDLKRALQKFRKWTQVELNSHLSQLLNLAPSNYATKLLVPYQDQLLPISVCEVACFYTSNKNTFIYLKNGKRYSYSKALEQIANLLDPGKFIRANKQFIIARDNVTNITVCSDSRLLVSLNIEVPESIFISKNKASEFKNWMVSSH